MGNAASRLDPIHLIHVHDVIATGYHTGTDKTFDVIKQNITIEK